MKDVQKTSGDAIPPLATTDGVGLNVETLKKISPCFIGLANIHDVRYGSTP